MTLRRLGPDDWAIFYDIRMEMLATEPASFGSSAEDWVQKSEQDVRQWLSDIHLVGVLDADRVVSCAGFYALQGRRMAHRGTVIAAYTRPTFRGQGLVGRIFAALEHAAVQQGIDQFELHVMAANTAAISAYKKAGYRIIGTMPRAVRIDGVDYDDHLMVKDLRASSMA